MISKSAGGGGAARSRILSDLDALAAHGMESLSRLAAAATQLAHSRAETRRVLAREVYRVPEEWLDDVIRVRMADAGREIGGEDGR